jgi:hypothetical protein
MGASVGSRVRPPRQADTIPQLDKDSYLYKSGSSYDTACASGLGGALFYYDKALGSTYDLRNKEMAGRAFRSLCEREATSVDAPKHLIDGSLINPKDLMVWDEGANKALNSLINRMPHHVPRPTSPSLFRSRSCTYTFRSPSLENAQSMLKKLCPLLRFFYSHA